MPDKNFDGFPRLGGRLRGANDGDRAYEYVELEDVGLIETYWRVAIQIDECKNKGANGIGTPMLGIRTARLSVLTARLLKLEVSGSEHVFLSLLQYPEVAKSEKERADQKSKAAVNGMDEEFVTRVRDEVAEAADDFDSSIMAYPTKDEVLKIGNSLISSIQISKSQLEEFNDVERGKAFIHL